MKTHLLIAIIILLPLFALSQDLIVTQTGDSLQCIITKETNKNISYNFTIGNQLGKSKILVQDVVAVQYNFYNANSHQSISSYKAKPVRLALNSGLSYRTAPISQSIPSNLKYIYEDLKSGYHFGGDFSAFISENIGIGAMFDWCKSTSNSRNYGEQKTDIIFVGPEVVARLLNIKKSAGLISSIAMGYVSYTYSNNGTYNQILGKTFGTSLSLGYDFNISGKIGLGLQCSYMNATLSKVQVKRDYELREVELKDEKEGLGRFDLSLGLRF